MSVDDQETCWTMIRRAAAGDAEQRAAFGRVYLPVMRAYLGSRWGSSPLQREIDDAVQEVFVECYRPDGVLVKTDPDRSGFRALLFGVLRNIALRYERNAARNWVRSSGETVYLDEIASSEDSHTRNFDSAWARALMDEATQRHEQRARSGDADYRRRWELLTLRIRDNVPIRDIAAQWGEDATVVHRGYAKARREFYECLRDVVQFHTNVPAERLAAECRDLVALL